MTCSDVPPTRGRPDEFAEDWAKIVELAWNDPHLYALVNIVRRGYHPREKALMLVVAELSKSLTVTQRALMEALPYVPPKPYPYPFPGEDRQITKGPTV